MCGFGYKCVLSICFLVSSLFLIPQIWFYHLCQHSLKFIICWPVSGVQYHIVRSSPTELRYSMYMLFLRAFWHLCLPPSVVFRSSWFYSEFYSTFCKVHAQCDEGAELSQSSIGLWPLERWDSDCLEPCPV